jgi:hypothetical protein
MGMQLAQVAVDQVALTAALHAWQAIVMMPCRCGERGTCCVACVMLLTAALLYWGSVRVPCWLACQPVWPACEQMWNRGVVQCAAEFWAACNYWCVHHDIMYGRS